MRVVPVCFGRWHAVKVSVLRSGLDVQYGMVGVCVAAAVDQHNEHTHTDRAVRCDVACSELKCLPLKATPPAAEHSRSDRSIGIHQPSEAVPPTDRGHPAAVACDPHRAFERFARRRALVYAINGKNLTV